MNQSPTTANVDIKPTPMPLYPTLNSMKSVVDLAISQLPGVPVNTIMTLFMCYHNTLLNELEKNNVKRTS